MVAHHHHFRARGQAQYDMRRAFAKRHNIFRSGWGGGKSHTLSDKGLERAAKNRGNGILGAQNYRQLTHVLVAKYIELAQAAKLDPLWKASDKVLLFRALPRVNQFGCQFAHCLSADAPESIRAVQGTWGSFDEPAVYSHSEGDATRDSFLQLQGRVRGDDVIPGIDWGGTNEGEGTRFYELQTSGRDDVAVFTGSTLDNIEGVGADFIRNVKETLPEELHEQYLNGGVGQLAQEMACWEWDDKYKAPVPVRVDFPLITCWDFGVAPMAMSVAQKLGAFDDINAPMEWCGEVVMKVRGNTADVCETFCETYRPQHPGPVYVFGDATGKAGSPQSKVDNYIQIKRIMERYWDDVILCVPASNPSPTARLVRFNAVMKRGLIRVDPSCANLLRDLRGCKLRQTESGPREDQRDGFSHSLVGASYPVNQLFPLVAEKPGQIDVAGMQRTAQRDPYESPLSPTRRVDPLDIQDRDGVSPW